MIKEKSTEWNRALKEGRKAFFFSFFFFINEKKRDKVVHILHTSFREKHLGAAYMDWL